MQLDLKIATPERSLQMSGGTSVHAGELAPGLLNPSVGHSTTQQFGISTASARAIPPPREARQGS